MPEPMRLSLFCSLYWMTDGEVQRGEGPHSITIWEPLDTKAPQDAKPYCYLLNDIDFRKPKRKWPKHVEDLSGEQWQEATCYQRQVKHHATSRGFGQPVLVFVEKTKAWYELGLGEVVWRKGQWFFKHNARKNTEAAAFANAGMPRFYRRRGGKTEAEFRLARTKAQAEVEHA